MGEVTALGNLNLKRGLGSDQHGTAQRARRPVQAAQDVSRRGDGRRPQDRCLCPSNTDRLGDEKEPVNVM